MKKNDVLEQKSGSRTKKNEKTKAVQQTSPSPPAQLPNPASPNPPKLVHASPNAYIYIYIYTYAADLGLFSAGCSAFNEYKSKYRTNLI